MYDYNARFYDPEIGQFTQPDSLVSNPFDPIAWNRYGYVQNNPVNYTDPTGHIPFWAGFGLFTLAVGGTFGGTTYLENQGYPQLSYLLGLPQMRQDLGIMLSQASFGERLFASIGILWHFTNDVFLIAGVGESVQTLRLATQLWGRSGDEAIWLLEKYASSVAGKRGLKPPMVRLEQIKSTIAYQQGRKIALQETWFAGRRLGTYQSLRTAGVFRHEFTHYLWTYGAPRGTQGVVNRLFFGSQFGYKLQSMFPPVAPLYFSNPVELAAAASAMPELYNVGFMGISFMLNIFFDNVPKPTF